MSAKIKKNDKVKIIAGRDNGKTSKVLRVFPKTNTALVEGVNLVKKHMRQTREDRPGGIVSKESPINLSNLLLVCSNCNKPTRTGKKLLSDKTKVRFCKRCQEVT